MPRYNRLSTIYVQPTASEVGLKDTFSQPGHTLKPGAAVYINTSGQLEGGNASSVSRSNIVGVVESVNGSDVVVVYQGSISFPAGVTSTYTSFPLVTGSNYYLSDSITGGITNGYTTENTSSLIKPILVPIDGYSGIVINSLPLSTTPLVSLFTPVGSIVPYVGGGSDMPAGWLLCAGDSLAKSGSYYTDLYDIVGEKYSVEGLVNPSTTGLTAYIKFDGSVYDPPTEGPGSTKNHSITNNDVYKLVWGTNQTVVQVYSATGTTHNITLKYLSSITGGTNFNALSSGTEVTLKSLVNGEASGYTSDKFFLPDFRGRSVIGAGTGRGLTPRSIGDIGGEETHLLTTNELPSHSHEIQLLNSTGISGSASYLIGTTGGSISSILSSYPQAQSAYSSVTGGSEEHENMSPFAVTNWIIRYKTNTGQSGIEVGPRGAKGNTGSQGIPGATGPTGIRGATGSALGALNYAYTSTTSIANGYWSDTGVSGTNSDLLLSSVEYYGSSVGDYISKIMLNNNSVRKGIAIVRSVNNPSSFLRIYDLSGPFTIINRPSSGGGIVTHYKMPIQEVLSSFGYGITGEIYSVLIIPSANEGSAGAKGATGAQGVTGSKGETGPKGETGTCGCTAGNYSKYSTASVYVSPLGDTVADFDVVKPHNLSSSEYSPSSYNTFVSSLSGTWGNTPTSEETEPIWNELIVKRSFNSAIQLTSQPCGGNDCRGASGYISLCDVARDINNSNYYIPPKETNIVLVKDSDNTVFNNEKTNVVNGCKVNIFASSDSFFTKVPVGLSSGLMETAIGSTGRNTLILDVLLNTSNISVGNYIGIRPEYFNLGLTASATGHQSLSGLYKVHSVGTNSIRAYSDVPFGASGAQVYFGYVTGGAAGDITRVDVYTVSVNFKDCSGYLVNSGELSLGDSAYGDPFVISFEGLTNTSDAAKAVISSGSAFVSVGENMGFYGWPTYGSALYATRNGTIKSTNNTFSKCSGSVISSNRNGNVVCKNPVISGNNYALVSRDLGSIEIETNIKQTAFTNIVNNGAIGLLDNGLISIKDSFSQLLANNYQSGFLFSGTSTLVVAGDARSIGLTGGTGISSNAVGGTGDGITNGASQAFLIVSPNASGNINLITGSGKYRVTVPSTSNITSYVADPGKGKVSKTLTSNISPSSLTTLDVTIPAYGQQ